MLKRILASLLFALVPFVPVSAGAPDPYTIVKNGDIPSQVGTGATFTGTVRREHFFRPTADAPFGVSLVTFAPGART